MQELLLYCCDVFKVITNMLDTHSWKQLLITSKCFGALKDRDSLVKRAHPLCYLTKYLLPDLLTKGLIGCEPLGYLADKMCKCLFTRDTINRYARYSPVYYSQTFDAILSSPHMTVELFNNTWLSSKFNVEALGANKSVKQEDLYTILHPGFDNEDTQIPSLDLTRRHPSHLYLTYGMVKSKRIDQLSPEFDLSFGYIRDMVASTYELNPDIIRKLKDHSVQNSLLVNPYLTFEELIKEPFEEFDYMWSDIAHLPQLTLEDVKRHPEFPWPKGMEDITLNNSIRDSLGLPKDANLLSILTEVYKQGVERLSLRINGLYLLAGTKVSFKELLDTARLGKRDGIYYHPYCITKHPEFDLATYFNSLYYLEGVTVSRKANEFVHLNPDFPLRSDEEWGLFIDKVRLPCTSLLYSKHHYITPSVIRKNPLIKWSMLDLLLTYNQVSMFDIAELYKEGLVQLAWPF